MHFVVSLNVFQMEGKDERNTALCVFAYVCVSFFF
jgi:hypothetical protein